MHATGRVVRVWRLLRLCNTPHCLLVWSTGGAGAWLVSPCDVCWEEAGPVLRYAGLTECLERMPTKRRSSTAWLVAPSTSGAWWLACRRGALTHSLFNLLQLFGGVQRHRLCLWTGGRVWVGVGVSVGVGANSVCLCVFLW